jgi:hypothetical protein
VGQVETQFCADCACPVTIMMRYCPKCRGAHTVTVEQQKTKLAGLLRLIRLNESQVQYYRGEVEKIERFLKFLAG